MAKTPNLSGDRVEEFQSLKSARRYISKEDYEELLADILKRERRARQLAALEKARAVKKARAEAAKAAAAAFAAEMAAKTAAKKAKREAAAKKRAEEKAQKTLDQFIKPKAKKAWDVEVGADIDDEGYAISQYLYRNLKGATVLLRLYYDRKLTRQVILKVGPTIDKFHGYMRLHFLIWDSYDHPVFDYDQHLGSLDDDTKIRVTVTEFHTPPPAKLVQRFAEGEKNCVAEPLAMLWEKMAENSESPASQKRCRQIVKAIRTFGQKYPDGIPEGDAMEQIARIAHRRIVIRDVLGGDFQEYNAKSSKTFHFTNTREHHVDVGHICLAEKPEIVSEARMAQLVEEHAGEFYMFDGIPNNVRGLRSLRGAWRVENPLHDIYSRHNAENGIASCGLDAVKYPEANRYLKTAAIVNAAPVKLSDVVPDNHLDLKNAYTQHAMTAYYRGFMGRIHQMRRLPSLTGDAARSFLDRHLGIYRFRVIENPVELLRTLGLMGTHILPGPEIMLYIDMGVRVELLSGIFGKRMDLTYSQEMMETKAYATWAGCMSYDHECTEYNFSGSWMWAQHLSATLGEEKVRFNRQDNTITVMIPKKANFTKHHILAFITSYTRINIVEAMTKIAKTATLCEVLLDGIYFSGEAEAPAGFRPKPIMSHLGYGEGWFLDIDCDDDWMPMLEDETLLDDCVLAGAGGSGKTTSILTDAGFVKPTYVVPTHRLGRKMREEHDVHYITIQKLIGIGCRPYKEENPEPPFLLIDEITMIEKSWIDKVREMYSGSLLFFAGDIMRTSKGFMWFQCRNGKPGQFSELWQGEGVGWKYYRNDYRSLDEKLKKLKKILRGKMIDIFTDGGASDAKALAAWIMAKFKVRTFGEAVGMFAEGDTWIAGTHRTNELLLKAGVVSGYLSSQNDMSREAVAGWEKRGSFTTHGFQGQTLSEGRVFVSVNDSFELAMFYTAVSRARRIEQIVFVE